MLNIRTSRQFALALFSWSIAAIVGLTFALVAVGFFHLWVLVGAVGAIGATLVTGFILQFALCTDMDALLEAHAAEAKTANGAAAMDRAA